MTKDPWLFEMRNKLPFCGCGDPGAAIMLIRRVLELHDDDDFPRLTRNLISDDGMRMLILGSLDDAGLLEHGGTIDGSWLTEDGRRFLTVMRGAFNDPDDAEDAEEFVDDISQLELS